MLGGPFLAAYVRSSCQPRPDGQVDVHEKVSLRSSLQTLSAQIRLPALPAPYDADLGLWLSCLQTPKAYSDTRAVGQLLGIRLPTASCGDFLSFLATRFRVDALPKWNASFPFVRFLHAAASRQPLWEPRHILDVHSARKYPDPMLGPQLQPPIRER